VLRSLPQRPHCPGSCNSTSDGLPNSKAYYAAIARLVVHLWCTEWLGGEPLGVDVLSGSTQRADRLATVLAEHPGHPGYSARHTARLS